MDTIRGFDNSDSNSRRVLTRSERLAGESRVDQLRNSGAAPLRQSAMTVWM
ncbi:hypothetical protein Gotur_012884 [Gossypium turneri]